MRTRATAVALLAWGLALPAFAQATAAPVAPSEPPPEALFFGKRCGGCHTLGDGDRVGPDLIGATDRRDAAWLRTFIRGPGAAIDRGDPIAAPLSQRFNNVRMPDQALTDEELQAVLGYIAACTKVGHCKIVLGKVRPASDATAADVAAGRALFEGHTPLQGGGPPCLSCHTVRGAGLLGGGTLAKDLTFAFARLGEQGTTAALASTPFPLMKDVFGSARPLTDIEQFQIKAYLADAARDGTPARADHDFFYAGALGLFLSLGAIGLLWSGRVHGVRQRVVKRGER